MKDDRTPKELGELLAEKALRVHGRAIAQPQSMLVSDSFDSFCRGRGFDHVQRRACEDAYKAKWEEIS